MPKIIKKADIALFFALLALCAVLSAFTFAGASAGKKAVITVDGKLYGTYSLSEDRCVEIKQTGRINKITIKGGCVQMTYSNCRGQICVKKGKISKAGQSIICLPNRVMVRIEGGKEGLDAVTG